ncbi:hypothetical protein IEQ34_001643 [Dendrobium chrysotoxum]|uniref:Uncharacterized protein n=1 Tax=Dendrobium chrysotoxum TaxID=161865 RepID=A0AAV7H7F0_DENCH|nr:hypothetical protein IEQ34_001643 [Dendrobium chrysotoxum]
MGLLFVEMLLGPMVSKCKLCKVNSASQDEIVSKDFQGRKHVLQNGELVKRSRRMRTRTRYLSGEAEEKWSPCLVRVSKRRFKQRQTTRAAIDKRMRGFKLHEGRFDRRGDSHGRHRQSLSPQNFERKRGGQLPPWAERDSALEADVLWPEDHRRRILSPPLLVVTNTAADNPHKVLAPIKISQPLTRPAAGEEHINGEVMLPPHEMVSQRWVREKIACSICTGLGPGENRVLDLHRARSHA